MSRPRSPRLTRWIAAAAIAAIATPAFSHGIWFAQRARQTALIYGIGADDLDMVKRLPQAENIVAYDAQFQPVKATANGVVVYSGAGLVGYGELIIIKHSDQWLSAYGHNRKRLVSEGAVVKAGQQIGEMGSTGATRNMLHFEIRLNGKPVDPQLYLPKR